MGPISSRVFVPGFEFQFWVDRTLDPSTNAMLDSKCFPPINTLAYFVGTVVTTKKV